MQSRFWKYLIVGILLSLLGCLLVIAALYTTSPDQYTVLVVGSDQRGTERARSDVLFVVSLPKSGTAQPLFLSIPRDTKIEDETYGLQKMTHFYALGERPNDGKVLGNIDLTKREVEELLQVEIDATVEVTFESFEEIVNMLRGVTISGKRQDGAAALALIRDRFTGGRSDFDRQADAREAFRSLFSKMKNRDTAKAIEQYMQESDQARLRYDRRELFHFLFGAGMARRGDLSIGEMDEVSLPGTSAYIYTPEFGKELYYWVPNQEGIQQLMKQYYSFNYSHSSI